MTDVLTSAQRHYNMSRIRGKNTAPEISVRRSLRRIGIRNYRVNSKLPGKPDIVFPESKVAVFIDGCFWHRCPIDFREPSTRRAFWRRKIEGNVKRDREVTKALKEAGWRVKRFWEHDVRKNPAKVAASIGLLVLYVPSSVGNSAKMIHLCSRC